MSIRDIDNDDRDWINEQARNGLALLLRYHIPEPTKISPTKIGAAVLGWRQDMAVGRPDEGDTLRVLGCLLGHYAVACGAGRWVVITDGFGTTLGIQRTGSESVFHPLDVVSKRMNVEAVEEIASAYDVFLIGRPATGRSANPKRGNGE